MIVVVVCLIKKNDQRFTTTTTKIGNFPEGVVGWVSLLVGWVQNSYFKKRPDQSKLIKLNFWFVVSILKLIILLLIKKLVVMVFVFLIRFLYEIDHVKKSNQKKGPPRRSSPGDSFVPGFSDSASCLGRKTPAIHGRRPSGLRAVRTRHWAGTSNARHRRLAGGSNGFQTSSRANL